MVIKKLVSIFFNFMGLRSRRRIKGSASYEAAVAITNIVKEGGGSVVDSPGGLKLCRALEEEEDELCCVCLSRLKEEEETLVLPCLHEFHRVCIDGWFNVCRKTCPVCRFSVEDDEDKFQKREEYLTEEMVIWFSSFHVAGF